MVPSPRMKVHADMVAQDDYLILMRMTVSMPMMEGMSMVQTIFQNKERLREMVFSKYRENEKMESLCLYAISFFITNANDAFYRFYMKFRE